MYNEIIDSVNALYDRQESFKGAYASVSDLGQVEGAEGDLALVLNNGAFPASIYRHNGTAWASTGKTWSPTESIDLAAYAKSIDIAFLVCDTAAATAAKTVSASGYSIKTGGNIRIKMTYANTSDNATLNINSTGNVPLYYDGARASSTNSWEAGETILVYYDVTTECFMACDAQGGGGKFANGQSVKGTGFDSTPTKDSTNLLNSGTVFDEKNVLDKTLSIELTGYPEYNYAILNTGKYGTSTTYHHAAIPVVAGEQFIIRKNSGSVRYAFCTAETYSSGANIPLVTGTSVVELGDAGDERFFTIPEGCTFLMFNAGSGYGLNIWKYHGKVEFDTQLALDSRKPLENRAVYRGIMEHVASVTPERASKDVGGNVWITSLTISKTGLVSAASSSTYVVVYYRNKLPRGTIVKFTATSSVLRSLYFCLMETDPADSENQLAAGTQLTTIYNFVNLGTWDVMFVVPEDGWLVYHFYNSNWSNRTIRFYFPSEVGKLVDIAENELFSTYLLSKDNFTSLSKTHRQYLKAADGQPNGSSYGESGVYYYTNDYFDVSDISRLIYYLKSKNEPDMALLAAYDENKNYISENSVIATTVSTKTGTWIKGDNTRYVRFTICYDNGNSTFYVYNPDLLKLRVDKLEEEVSPLSGDLTALSRFVYADNILENFTSRYGSTGRRYINGGTGANSGTYGNSGIYYATGYVDMTGIEQLNYKLPFTNKSPVSAGVAMIAAYDANKNYLQENSVIYKAINNTGTGTWIKGENTAYVRFTVYYNNGNGKYYANISGTLESRVDELEVFAQDPNNINVLNRDRESVLRQITWESDKAGNTTRKWLRLAHFSDLHGDTTRLRRIVEWCEEHSTLIHDCVNTGDTVASKYANKNVYASVAGAKNILTAIGNHDCAGTTSGKTDWYKNRGVNAYNKFIKPYITTTEEFETEEIDPETGEPIIETIVTDNWGVTQPDGAEENGYCYYYKDYDSGFRLIVLDGMSYTSDGHQRTWFQGVLEDARTKALTVVCAHHFCIRAKHTVKTNFASWSNGNGSGYGNATINGVTTYNSAGTIFTDVQSFIDAGGKFACHLVGHSHSDKIYYVGSQSSYSGSTATSQLAIQVDAACCTSSADHWMTKRVQSGRAQDSFNVVAINRTDGIIVIIKIGCDANIIGQHVDWVSVRYGIPATEQLYTVGNASYIADNYVEPDHDEDGDVDDSDE